MYRVCTPELSYYSKHLVNGIQKLFTDCFEHLGTKVTYCNQNRQPICEIKALIKRPDRAYSLGDDGRFTTQVASIEIRCRDITFLNVGDYIKVGNKFYKIFEQPLKDPSNNLWEIQAIES